jgi:hypothetical protein
MKLLSVECLTKLDGKKIPRQPENSMSQIHYIPSPVIMSRKIEIIQFPGVSLTSKTHSHHQRMASVDRSVKRPPLTPCPLRRQVRRGLLKVDQLHRLARDVAYAKQGKLTKQEFTELMKSCSCLTLILACIVYWQAKEIGRVIAECNPEENGIDISLLEHISPVEWENIVLYGQYVIDPHWVR